MPLWRAPHPPQKTFGWEALPLLDSNEGAPILLRALLRVSIGQLSEVARRPFAYPSR